MNGYFIPLKSKKIIAKDTMVFEFNKPKGFKFKAGQSIDMTLGTQVYPFSIAAAPDENVVRIATRMRDSEFKKNLKKLKIGEKVRIQGPSGDFILPKKTDRPIIFVAGGIGITPFYSMIKSNPPHKFYLFYKNSSPVRAAFLDEFRSLGIRHSKLVIDRKAVYYLCGPPGFVAKYRKILDSKGINEDNIRTEEFSGY